jgi:chemotaxis protein methyltransferase CheR
MIPINDAEFELLKDYLHTVCGIDIPPEKRYLFVTRLTTLLSEMGCANFSQFYRRVNEKNEAELRVRLVESMTTNETSFFRDEHPFETLQKKILPAIARKRVESVRYTRPRIRIWSVGCASGEEPYSIAISVFEWLEGQEGFARSDVSILAVDIYSDLIRNAQQATYDPDRIRKSLPPGIEEKYFRKRRFGVTVREDVRAMVSFAELNLSETFDHLGYFDVIFCRNVMIYFSIDLKKRIVEQFHKMLQPGGVLLMGASESLYHLSDRFRVVHEGQTTYYLKE